MKKEFPIAPFVRTFFEDYLRCRRNLSRNTIRSYRDALKLLLPFAASQTRKPVSQLAVADVDEKIVLNFLSELEGERSNSIQTRNQRLTSIRRLFDFIASQEPLLMDHCRRVVMIPPKRGVRTPEIQYLDKMQMMALLDSANGTYWSSQRDYAMLLFMYNTGARVQEVVDSRISWLTLSAPAKVQLLGKRNKWRTCPLWDNTAETLERLLQQRRTSPEDRLFLNRQRRPLSRSGVADIIRRLTIKAAATEPGLKNMKVTPHVLRHTTAMHLLQSGVEVNVIRAWLGHVSINTTNRYIDIDMAMKEKALQACQPTAPTDEISVWRDQPEILAWLESL